MEFTVRKPKATDLFVVSKIIRGIGLNNIKECFSSIDIMSLRNAMMKENETVDELGNITHTEFSNEQLSRAGVVVVTSIADLILEKMDVIQNDVFKYMSNVTGLDVKVVEDLPITDFAEILMAIIKEPDFVDFIKVVLKSFN